MDIHCKYCGFTVHYEDGRGWYPGYVQEVRQHILDEHVRETAVEHRDEDGVLHIECGLHIDPGYSNEFPNKGSATVTYDPKKPTPF